MGRIKMLNRWNFAAFHSLYVFFAFLHLSVDFTAGDTFYQEGFIDQANIPENLPYTVDTKRYSDGISSHSSFESMTPAFPIAARQPGYYRANISERYKYYREYFLSAQTQGLGLEGDGDEAREVARLRVLEEKRQFDPTPCKNFTVYANIKWNPSGFAIQEGDFFSIKVLGNSKGYGDQMWYDGGIRVDSEGYTSYFDSLSNCHVAQGRCRSHLIRRRRLQSAPWMHLTCAIGSFVTSLVDIEPGTEPEARWMPIDESQVQQTLFAVGKGLDFRASSTGELMCFANDGQLLYWNNRGSIEVQVCQAPQSWPVSNETYYQQRKVPACDAAISVYANYGKKFYLNENGFVAVEDPNLECNPEGGGAGWSLDDITSNEADYGIGTNFSITAGVLVL